MLLGGSIGDRFGRKKWMTVGLVIFGAGAVGGALAGGATELIIARGVQGLGAALVLPATLSIITNVFPRGERAKAIGIWTGVGALGLGIGPALGGFLVDEAGWASVMVGMFGNVRILTGDETASLAISADAVQNIDGQPYLFIQEEPGLFELRRVTIGANQDGMVVIQTGLVAHDQVVTSQGFALKSEVLKARLGASCADH